jgi:hypothetical protein
MYVQYVRFCEKTVSLEIVLKAASEFLFRVSFSVICLTFNMPAPPLRILTNQQLVQETNRKMPMLFLMSSYVPQSTFTPQP